MARACVTSLAACASRPSITSVTGDVLMVSRRRRPSSAGARRPCPPAPSDEEVGEGWDGKTFKRCCDEAIAPHSWTCRSSGLCWSSTARRGASLLLARMILDGTIVNAVVSSALWAFCCLALSKSWPDCQKCRLLGYIDLVPSCGFDRRTVSGRSQTLSPAPRAESSTFVRMHGFPMQSRSHCKQSIPLHRRTRRMYRCIRHESLFRSKKSTRSSALEFDLMKLLDADGKVEFFY